MIKYLVPILLLATYFISGTSDAQPEVARRITISNMTILMSSAGSVINSSAVCHHLNQPRCP